MTTDDKPSAFVDSPEDLVRKARAAVSGGRMDPEVAVLMTDLARELAKSREGHATRMAMVTSVGSEMNALREENKRLNDGTELRELREQVKTLNRFRMLSYALMGALAFDVVLGLWTFFHR